MFQAMLASLFAYSILALALLEPVGRAAGDAPYQHPAYGSYNWLTGWWWLWVAIGLIIFAVILGSISGRRRTPTSPPRRV